MSRTALCPRPTPSKRATQCAPGREGPTPALSRAPHYHTLFTTRSLPHYHTRTLARSTLPHALAHLSVVAVLVVRMVVVVVVRMCVIVIVMVVIGFGRYAIALK